MEILGKKGEHNLFYIDASVSSSHLVNPINIEFMVDTGAANTCLSRTDTIRNSINIFDFKNGESLQGSAGMTETFELRNCDVIFSLIGTNIKHKEILDMIYMFHEPNLNEDRYGTALSVLGLDILEKFRISFESDKVVLEK